METSNLRAFLTVAEYQSFSKAADALFLTQPAVSKRIAALEQELKTKLFDRVGRHVCLTEAGNTLLPTAKQVLSTLDDCKHAITNQSDQVSGRLSLGTSHHVGLRHLPPILRQYTQKYSAVNIDLVFMDSEEACQNVETTALELAIVTLPKSRYQHIHLEKIWDDPLSIVVSNSHSLLNETDITLSSLQHHPAILPSQGTVTRQILEQFLVPHNVRISTVLESNYLETIRMMVSVGLGWSLLPTSMVDDDLISLPIEGPELHRELGIVWHKGRSLSRAAQALIEEIKSHQKMPNKIDQPF